MIIHSQEFEKKCREVPCPPPPAITPTSPISTAQYRNQETDIGTIHRVYSDVTSYTCTYCVLLYTVLSHIGWNDHHNNQDAELYHHHEIPHVISL